MGVIEKFMRKPAGPLAPAIETTLKAAEQHLAQLEGRLGDARLDSELGKPNAGTNLTALGQLLAAARDDVTALREAHRRALERDQQAEAEAYGKARGGEFAAMAEIAKDRLAAMAEVAAGIEKAARGFRKFVDATGRMDAALPLGTALPSGMLSLDNGALLVAAEMYRHAGAIEHGQRGTLPGAKAPFDLIGQPDKIEPAVEAIKRENDFVLEAVRGQIGGRAA